MTGRDFHHDRSGFSWRTIEIFSMKSPDFHDERSRFSSWQVQIFIMTGRDFLHDRSRFSSWKVHILIMTGPDFHHDRSRFSSWQVQNCLLLGLKSQSVRGGSPHPAFMANCLTISHTYQPYLPSKWALLFVCGRWVNLRFYLFVHGVNQNNERGRWVQGFLVLPQRFGASLSLFASEMAYLVCVEVGGWCYSELMLLEVDAIGGWSYWRLMLLEVDATLSDGFGIWEYLCSFREIKYLQGCFKILWTGI